MAENSLADSTSTGSDSTDGADLMSIDRKNISMQDIGKQSSIGDVGTLRTRLQDRRITLNEEIGKENQLRRGTKKLMGVTLDHKIRDQVALEMNFSESKIKALQAELTKINNSLQVYQTESARETQVPLIPLAMKTTTKVNFVPSFSEIISKHYHTDPSALQDSIYDFQELRHSLSTVSRDQAGIELLYSYYNQMQLAAKRFLHPKMRHCIAFIWYDAVNGLPAAQQSTVFERACVLFNIAALHTQIAAQQDRSSVEGIDMAVRELENAIGCFEYMKDKFSNSPTMDMSSEILALLSDLMRAQSQELLWERETSSGLRDNLMSMIDHAHRTKSVAECYRPLRELIDEDTVKAYLPDCWITLIKIKEAHFKSLAHYYAAVVHQKLVKFFSEGGQIAEEVRTELNFLYSDGSPEVVCSDPLYHAGFLKSHLNCAALLHEYALKYDSLCRDLRPVYSLHVMLKAAEERTKQKRRDVEGLQSLTVMAATIQASAVKLTPILPKFTAVKVQDMFQALGPLPAFSAENSWSTPRTVTLKKEESGYGFSIRGSRPATITGVDEGSEAEAGGMKVGDWLLAVNGVNAKNKPHREVVKLVRECGGEVTLEITTPVRKN